MRLTRQARDLAADSRRRGAVWKLVVIAVTVPVAAVVARLAPPAAQVVFRGGVDYVSVDVVVTGAGEKPLTGLAAGDFEIRENGKPQRVTDFRYVDIPVAHRTIDLAQPPAPAPDVVTNAPKSPNSRLFVMIVDDLHLIESMTIPIQRVMTEFLSTLSPDDEVAILFAGRSDLSQNFTTDTGRLVKTIKNVRAALGFGIGVSGIEQLEELPYDRSVVWQLTNVANALAHSGHARRAIVFVGAFSQLDPGAAIGSRELMDAQLVQDDMNKAWDAARRSDVPIYTLDPRGIPTPENSESKARHGVVREMAGLQERSASTTSRTVIQQDHLAEIAINTGGRAFINRSDLTGAVDEIVGENGSFYVLGYYPDPYARDGKFHDISVTVTRPGAHVRARPGYVAADSAPPAGDLKEALDSAMSTGVNVSGLTMTAFAAPLAAGAKGVSTVVSIEVAYPVPVDGSRHVNDDLQVSVMALDPDGKVKASSSRPWHFSGATPVAGTVTFLVDDVVELPSQPLTLRVGVVSKALGKAGTIQMPIEVPKLADNKLQLSGVAIGFAGATREAAMGADALKNLVPFQPTTARTFAATDTLRVFARAFWGTKDAGASATLTVTRSGAAAGVPQNVTLVAAGAPGSHREAVLDATLPLTGLTAGEYVLHVDARLASGQTTRRDVVFAIKQPEEP